MISLSTLDILKEIDKDSYAKRYFIGVYPRNRLPAIKSYPASLIVNTDPSGKPGEHWLAIYFNKSKELDHLVPKWNFQLYLNQVDLSQNLYFLFHKSSFHKEVAIQNNIKLFL